MYQDYQSRENVSVTFSLLSLGPKRKVKCHNEYFINGHVFYIEEYEYGRKKKHNNGVYVKGSTFNEFEVDYYWKLEEVIELQYHSEHIRVFLFKYYWYNTTNREIRVDPHHGLVEINSKARLYNVNDVFIFAKPCQQVYGTYNSFFRKNRSIAAWLSIVKTKSKGYVEVVQDDNNELIIGDDVF